MTANRNCEKLYRSREGMICGVCKGISDYFGINVSFIRFVLVVLTIFTGFFPFGLIYICAALFLSVEPAYKEKYSYHSSSAKRSFYDRKDSEADRERDWESRFRK